MRLLVARHGATAHNLGGRITGQTDAPLSPLGLRQAGALAARLAGLRFDALVSSDLVRASVTAERIARVVGLPVTLDPALREIAMGAWEGRTGHELRREAPERFARVIEDPTGEEAAPGGESWAHFTARVDAARARWQAQYPAGRVLWVAHGGV
ncbi:MAG TPA: histidine phosphatase family protein, partial [Ktedonobacterales bacterium]|nr:histidine phosphatase family protein [Ktedonobacterales bacterium]